MSRISEKVKKWRQRTKERMVESLGGVCCVCKNKYPNPVYDFHHIDGEKEFKLTCLRSSPRSWNKIVIELRKCVLTCANCHRLLHAGIEEVPKDAIRFNEEYALHETIRR